MFYKSLVFRRQLPPGRTFPPSPPIDNLIRFLNIYRQILYVFYIGFVNG